MLYWIAVGFASYMLVGYGFLQAIDRLSERARRQRDDALGDASGVVLAFCLTLAAAIWPLMAANFIHDAWSAHIAGKHKLRMREELRRARAQIKSRVDDPAERSAMIHQIDELERINDSL